MRRRGGPVKGEEARRFPADKAVVSSFDRAFEQSGPFLGVMPFLRR